ncbi:IMS-domain-containing protein [Hysterangium stoloniferum]|nr:IMS-domain-containing protein [Hysterangium stoloniferum]
MEESLVKRLAGPSTEKAGLAKDQTDINRIIAKASKGSKFYENEKRKDQELTAKIENLLKRKDEMMRDVDIGRLEANIDKTISKLEEQRDLSQYIVHVDMDAFYASVELLDRPHLKGKPFGVGKGVLCTASYDARTVGVRSGMPGFIAKKLCPHIILLPLRMDRYCEMSSKVMHVFRQFDPTMASGGIDEAYLNITKYCNEHNLSPDQCVEKLRAEVHAKTRLTVSAGIAPTKMLAKICSDKNKPNGQYHLPFERGAILDFMHDLPIRKVPGIGRVSERLLDSIGVKTCGDIHTQRAVLFLLDKQFHLDDLLLTYLGITSNVVAPGQRNERKSVGLCVFTLHLSFRTFNPISDSATIIEKLNCCAAELEADMKSTGWAGQTITLKYKLDTYQGESYRIPDLFTRAKSLTRYVSSKADLFSIGMGLLRPELPLNIRLIGLRVTKLKDLRAPEEPRGLKRFFEAATSTKKLQEIDHIVGDETGHTLEEEKAMAECEDEHDQQQLTQENTCEGDEVDDDDEITCLDLFEAESSMIKPKSRKTCFSNSSTNQTPGKQPTSESTKSKMKSKRPKSPDAGLSCPMCSKVLDTDNVGLNEHIDFCLSKSVIFAATTVRGADSSSTKRQRVL